MKWKNRGHEFDSIANIFLNKKEIFIYGAGECGKKFCEMLENLDVPTIFIDGDRNKQIHGCMGKSVLSPMQLFSMPGEKKNVVIATMPCYIPEIQKTLENQGYIYKENFWELEEFCQNILPIYMMYIKNKVYMDSIGFLSTTVCNLRCDACLNFTPYNKHPEHVKLEKAKQTLDFYFKAIDYVRFMSYTGGEPLLYPYINELLDYIGKNYRNKIYTIGMSTNCTIIPDDSTCEKLKKYNIHVFVDDYSKYVEKSRNILPNLTEKLEKYGIIYCVNKGEDAYWIDLAPFETDNTNLSEGELINYRDRCSVPYREVRDNKIYSCNYASFAIKAGILGDSENDYFDLSGYSEDHKKELMEFILGYTEKGYVDFCKHCAGFLPINPYKKPVGRQIGQK
ncbi:MAG: radical SAM protein [Hungatella sp.]|nr:radical SAM protein [Hungatella sp.]